MNSQKMNDKPVVKRETKNKIRVDFEAKDKGGYEVLDIIFDILQDINTTIAYVFFHSNEFFHIKTYHGSSTIGNHILNSYRVIVFKNILSGLFCIRID